ncbi:MAG TPA: altronate dehydratase family protein [Kofleriaceae bacterium]|jgi:altronate hydrolase|nr:altronate dehydratase family protein [Kofleriaceae bacterium]
MQGTLQLHPDDDVAIAKLKLPKGTAVDTEAGPVTLTTDVPAGHKIAVRRRAAGEPVRRYGQVIGVATAPIAPGEHVHRHNLGIAALHQEFAAATEGQPTRYHPASEMRTFDGFVRSDGRVGTRNYVLVIPTVNCSATVVKMVADRFRDVAREFPNVDGVVALPHKGGCGLVAQGDDHQLLQRVITGYAHHPNVGATVVVSLGCEVNQAEPLVQLALAGRPVTNGKRLPVVTIQREGGTRKAVEAAVAEIARLLPQVDAARRTSRPASDLVVATNCGGSDGYSGITANPALGWAMDEIVRYGGTALLAETPEIHGAEQLLVRRARDEAVARKLLARIAWWEAHLARHGAKTDHNPSPGNIAGGITTVYEKALGGVAKAGTTQLVDVIDYAEPVKERGLVFMDTPGYDPVSVTGLVAGGANLVCFTTGRGSVFGCKPAPSIKLATSSTLYRHMTEDMDIDCGTILEGASIAEVGRQILDDILAVASGKRTKSELLGMGDEEFAPWQTGPTL